MPIIDFQRGGPGENTRPFFVHINTNDTLATVAAAGYLNPFMASMGVNVKATDFVFVSALDGHQIYKPVFTGTTITLTVLP